jgi:hypothetical protein
VPFFVFHPRRARIVAGLLLISFQGLLILSGNLSFLNYLTIAPAIACFDDGFLRRALPGWIIRRSDASAKDTPFHPRQAVTSWLVLVMVALLSAPVVANLMSSRQLMNTTFNPFYLVNTYGAFGSVGRERHELILEGTDEETVTDQTVWQEYGFKAKPGDPQRRPPIISPYHYRVDWQIWFAAMQTPSENPWLLHLIWKLLANDPDALSLLDGNPFPNDPPRHIRVSIFHYRFAELDDPGGAWWKRTYIGEWLPPLSRSTPEFQKYIDAFGWKN